MALSGSFNTSSSHGRYMIFSWTATQSIEDNLSIVSWELTGAGDSGWISCSELNITIAGETVATRSSSEHMNVYPGTIFAYGTTVINHDSDGGCTFGANVNVGIYSYSCNCSGSGIWTLDTIARASEPSCITYPYNTQEVGDMGNSIIIHMNRKSDAFTHTATYSFGNDSGTIGTDITNNITWTIPLSLANQIPNTTYGTGIITVYTYNGGTYIGQKSIYFTCSVPESIVPTIDTISSAVVNDNSVISGWGIAVSGYTKLGVAATASGAYGSTISSFTVSGGYNITIAYYALYYVGDVINSVGDITFNVVAKDSRGRTSAVAVTSAITFYPYSNPIIYSIGAERLPTNQKKIMVRANWTYSTINNHNSVNAILKYKESKQTVWTTYGSIQKNELITLPNDFEETNSYNFIVIITDSLSKSAQVETFVSTMKVLLDFRAGGNGLGIGKIAESDSLEINLNTIFFGDIYINNGNENVSLDSYIRNIVNGG